MAPHTLSIVETRNQFRSAYARLEQLVPPKLRLTLTWLGEPEARAVRLPLSVLCIIGGCLSFLPGLGIELLPLGLMLMAHDVKPLRRPAGDLTMWMLDLYERAARFSLEQHARWVAWCTWVGAGMKKTEPEVAPGPDEHVAEGVGFETPEVNSRP